MKPLTHYIFSYGLSLYLVSISPYSAWIGDILALLLSFTLNTVIEAAVDDTRNNAPIRISIIHSVYAAPLWGALLGAVFVIIPARFLDVTPNLGLTLFFAGVGALLGLGHLLLDAMTESGMFSAGSRIAIARFGYYNTVLNYSFISAGLVLLFFALF